MCTFRWIPVAVGLSLLCSCAPEKDDPADDSAQATGLVVVYTVNYPLQYFAERIGGERVDARFPGPSGEDPAYWSPDTETIAAFQKADLLLLNGAGYAKWTERAALPESKLVDTSAGFEDRYVPMETSLTHSHGLDGEHSHEGAAFTTWLDPALAAEQARAIADALIRLGPEHEADFEAGYEALVADLKRLDDRIARVLQGMENTPLFFSHPVYQYLVRRYHLNTRSFHWEPDEAPTPEMWRELDEVRGAHPARHMVWEGEPLPDTVRRLGEWGIESLVVDPCGAVPDSGDYLSVMKDNADRLEAIRP